MKPRYRVTEALKGPPISVEATVTSTENQIIITAPVAKAIIHFAPFRMEFFESHSSNVASVIVNGQGLLRYEHLRSKPQTLDPNEDPDSWEEGFREFIDPKPNGPEAVAVDFTFPGSEILFGIPEHADSFALKSTIGEEPYRLFTSDVPAYETESRWATYGAVPVIYAHTPERTTGIFWQNSADTFIDIHHKNASHFISEAGIIDVFVLLGPSPKEAFAQYTKLTGVGNLPQLFTLGLHQCRWSYYSQNEVIEVVDNYDKFDFQLDTIWLDIDYTDGKRYFTWNYEAFPNPLGLMSYLKSIGLHLTYIIDPHIKKDENYFFYSNNSAMGYFVKNPNGTSYEGECWPGLSSYVDFSNPDASRYYADQYLLSNFADNSIETGIWNDMNEPAVFEGPEKSMPREMIHHGGWEHRLLHNQYGFLQTKATFDGVLRRSNGELRPFILTRAFFSGAQRYTAIWTGDNAAGWNYLEASIKMCLSVSVGGNLIQKLDKCLLP